MVMILGEANMNGNAAELARAIKRIETLEKENHTLKLQVNNLQSKAARQRQDLARTIEKMERLVVSRDKLLKDLKWMRGER